MTATDKVPNRGATTPLRSRPRWSRWRPAWRRSALWASSAPSVRRCSSRASAPAPHGVVRPPASGGCSHGLAAPGASRHMLSDRLFSAVFGMARRSGQRSRSGQRTCGEAVVLSAGVGARAAQGGSCPDRRGRREGAGEHADRVGPGASDGGESPAPVPSFSRCNRVTLACRDSRSASQKLSVQSLEPSRRRVATSACCR